MANSWGVSWGTSWGDSWGGAAAGDATAPGALLTVTASLITGQATGAAIINQGVGPPPRDLHPLFVRNGRAFGKTLTVKARLIPGRATSFSLIAEGRAVGSAAATGQIIELRAVFSAGVASGDANVQAETKSLSASILPGAASGFDDDEDAVAAWLLAA